MTEKTYKIDTEKVQRGQKKMINALVGMQKSVEEPLRRTQLPEMPPAVKIHVASAIQTAIAGMSEARSAMAAAAHVLHQIAQKAGYHDATARMPWWYEATEIRSKEDLSLVMDEADAWSRDIAKQDRDLLVGAVQRYEDLVGVRTTLLDPSEFTKGFLNGAGQAVDGARVLGRLNPVNTALDYYLGRTTAAEQLARGAREMRRHPWEATKKIVRWDLIKKGKYSQWLGEAGFNAALTAVTAGAGGAASATVRTTANVRRARLHLRETVKITPKKHAENRRRLDEAKARLKESDDDKINGLHYSHAPRLNGKRQLTRAGHQKMLRGRRLNVAKKQLEANLERHRAEVKEAQRNLRYPWNPGDLAKAQADLVAAETAYRAATLRWRRELPQDPRAFIMGKVRDEWLRQAAEQAKKDRETRRRSLRGPT